MDIVNEYHIYRKIGEKLQGYRMNPKPLKTLDFFACKSSYRRSQELHGAKALSEGVHFYH